MRTPLLEFEWPNDDNDDGDVALIMLNQIRSVHQTAYYWHCASDWLLHTDLHDSCLHPMNFSMIGKHLMIKSKIKALKNELTIGSVCCL